MRNFYYLLFFAFSISMFSQTVWNSSPITFTKDNNADPTLEENQDRITDNVWITRGNVKGIYNIVSENFHTAFSSPADTEWAMGTTADIATLTFTDWKTAVDEDPPASVGLDMVVHLITDDIYIDIKFLSWTSSAGGGGFSYERATQNLGVSDVEYGKEYSIYPNPASDFIKVEGLTQDSKFVIHDMNGRQMLNGLVEDDSSINIEQLKSGVYLIQFEEGKTVKFTKK